MYFVAIDCRSVLFTFRVSRTGREMYCGHAGLCVCPRPHAHIIARTRM